MGLTKLEPGQRIVQGEYDFTLQHKSDPNVVGVWHKNSRAMADSWHSLTGKSSFGGPNIQMEEPLTRGDFRRDVTYTLKVKGHCRDAIYAITSISAENVVTMFGSTGGFITRPLETLGSDWNLVDTSSDKRWPITKSGLAEYYTR